MVIKKKKTPSEKTIENAILSYLGFVSGCFAWKNNTMGVYDPSTGKWRKSKNRYAINGVSDILGVYKGKALAIEVKTIRGKVSDDQQNFIDTFRKNGGIAGVARSVQDARDIIRACDEEYEDEEEDQKVIQEEGEPVDTWPPQLRKEHGINTKRTRTRKRREEEAEDDYSEEGARVRRVRSKRS